jgi:hypothetical protein
LKSSNEQPPIASCHAAGESRCDFQPFLPPLSPVSELKTERTPLQKYHAAGRQLKAIICMSIVHVIYWYIFRCIFYSLTATRPRCTENPLNKGRLFLLLVYILTFREIFKRMSLALFWSPYVATNICAVCVQDGRQ